MNQDLVFQMKISHLRVHLAAGEQEIAQGQGTALKSRQDIQALFSDIKHKA